MFAIILAALAAPGETVSLTVDGVERTALVFRPQVSTSKPPVYFVFHGYTASSREAAAQFNLQSITPDSLVIYPQGLPISLSDAVPGNGRRRSTSAGRRGGGRGGDSVNTDSRGGKPGWQILPGQANDRDLKFLDALTAWAEQQGADSTREYVAGHSNGSIFTNLVYATRGEHYAAFAALEGKGYAPITNAAIRPVFLSSGSNDPLAKPQGIQEYAQSVAQHNGCGQPTGTSPLQYPGPAPVELYTYTGGHVPPRNTYQALVNFCQRFKHS